MLPPAVPVMSPIDRSFEVFSTMMSSSVVVAISLPDATTPLRFCTLMLFFAVSVIWLSPVKPDVPYVPATTFTFAGAALAEVTLES